MPLRLALAAIETVAGHRLGALEGGGGGATSPLPIHPWGGGGVTELGLPTLPIDIKTPVKNEGP